MPLINIVTGEAGPTSADVAEALRLLGLDRKQVEEAPELPGDSDDNDAYALLGEVLAVVQAHVALSLPEYGAITQSYFHDLRRELFDEPCCSKHAHEYGDEPRPGRITRHILQSSES